MNLDYFNSILLLDYCTNLLYYRAYYRISQLEENLTGR